MTEPKSPYSVVANANHYNILDKHGFRVAQSEYECHAQLIVDSVNEFEELEYKYSMALAREGQLKLRLFDNPEELRRIKRMTLWDRIFNWPY